jgi:hypothetical protein
MSDISSFDIGNLERNIKEILSIDPKNQKICIENRKISMKRFLKKARSFMECESVNDVKIRGYTLNPLEFAYIIYYILVDLDLASRDSRLGFTSFVNNLSFKDDDIRWNLVKIIKKLKRSLGFESGIIRLRCEDDKMPRLCIFPSCLGDPEICSCI